MARSRNIKPSIMENEDLADLDPIARLLFIYLWMLADREGRLEDRPKRIAGRALPYDRDVDVDDLLGQLAGAGFITRYTVGDLVIIQINNFAKHQKPHVRETASELPSIDQSTTKAVTKHYLGSVEALPRSPDSLLPLTDSLLPITDGQGGAQTSGEKDDPPGFQACWSIYPKRDGGNSRSSALKAYRARLNDGATPADLLAGVQRYAAYTQAKGIFGTSYVKQASTFFGPDDHWREDWVIPNGEGESEKPEWLQGAI